MAIETLRRHEKLSRLEPASGETPGADTVATDVAQNERRDLVHEALATLPPEHRSVVVLRYTHGLKQREIAEALSCTERTARNRLRAAAVLLERELRRRGVVTPREEVA